MATIPAPYLRRIQRDLPGTATQHLDAITEGMVNDVVVVDHTWVYRFARHDWGKPLLQHEVKVLDLVRRHVDVAVPHLQSLGDDGCRYPFLAGVPLTRRALLGWSEADRAPVLRSVVRSSPRCTPSRCRRRPLQGSARRMPTGTPAGGGPSTPTS